MVVAGYYHAPGIGAIAELYEIGRIHDSVLLLLEILHLTFALLRRRFGVIGAEVLAAGFRDELILIASLDNIFLWKEYASVFLPGRHRFVDTRERVGAPFEVSGCRRLLGVGKGLPGMMIFRGSK